MNNENPTKEQLELCRRVISKILENTDNPEIYGRRQLYFYMCVTRDRLQSLLKILNAKG